MSIDPRFLKTSGVEAFTGNELLVKGALEAGVGLITGYPGSPVSDVFDCITSLGPYLAERGVVAQIANNEGLATARLTAGEVAGDVEDETRKQRIQQLILNHQDGVLAIGQLPGQGRLARCHLAAKEDQLGHGLAATYPTACESFDRTSSGHAAERRARVSKHTSTVCCVAQCVIDSLSWRRSS